MVYGQISREMHGLFRVEGETRFSAAGLRISLGWLLPYSDKVLHIPRCSSTTFRGSLGESGRKLLDLFWCGLLLARKFVDQLGIGHQRYVALRAKVATVDPFALGEYILQPDFFEKDAQLFRPASRLQ